MKPELDSFEQELRRLKPSEPPPVFKARLVSVRPVEPAVPPTVFEPQARPDWLLRWWRAWLAPAGAMALLVGALAWWTLDRSVERHSRPQPARQAASDQFAHPESDEVEIDHRLMDTYEAVAELPSSPPVRVRVNEWLDKVVFRDTARGLAIERQEPRIQIVPVRYESY